MAVDPSPPPNKEKFMLADRVEKLKMLSDVWLEQFKSVETCNLQLEGIREWRAYHATATED